MVVDTVDETINYMAPESDSGTKAVLAGVEPERGRHGSKPGGCVWGAWY